MAHSRVRFGRATHVFLAAAALALLAAAVVAPVSLGAQVGADQALPAPPGPSAAAPGAAASDSLQEVRDALIRLPLAALLGAVLALRPRRLRQGRRNALVVQTQIMLAVVGAVIMLVVGQSLARAFGIVGAANLIRYRSTVDDPKDAVVMLCALAAGLAAGVGLYRLAPFATVFMAVVLWVVEHFEPTAERRFELKVSIDDAPAFRPRLEAVLTGLRLPHELLVESSDELGYVVKVPGQIRTLDVSDTIRALAGKDELSIEWDEKRSKD